MPQAPAQLLTTGDAARLAGVAVETIRLWERIGKLPGARTAGGVRLFTREAVLDAMHERATRIEQRSLRTAQHVDE
jgi:excisionase family DNA binding protein